VAHESLHIFCAADAAGQIKQGRIGAKMRMPEAR
jgi:hypothetical protein